MDYQWLKNKLTVGLECVEKMGIEREDWPDFLAQDIINNDEQIQRAAEFQNKLLQRIEDHPLVEGHTVRDTPTYYDRNE